MQLISMIPVLDRMKCSINSQKAALNRESISKMEKYTLMQNIFWPEHLLVKESTVAV